VSSQLAPGRLTGKVALVTGASRGLGAAIALELARAGAHVVVAARTETTWSERLPGTVHDTVATIVAAGGRALAVVADLAREEDLERLVDTTTGKVGPVDVLVNNAAVTVGGRPPAPGSAPAQEVTTVSRQAPSSFLDFPFKAYQLHMRVNVFAAFRLMQLVLPGMIGKGAGSIVNVSSSAAFNPGEGPYPVGTPPALFAYGSAKAALHNLTQAVALEVAPRGVAANVLIPSLPIHTPGADSLLEGYGVQRWASAEDFARAAVELAVADPAERCGQILFHDDVLHPELGRRGYLSTEVQ
jgi:NAD(P)-dependent dehydrogenase (short-subunit alcohol dehydrogenase family)